ncbi:flagellar hook-basal body protein [Halobacillus litoralis]|uniref:flagellar hook-basal body protein n=1 Tax=Halobacillus litoralis TaxID=45668 RepID=UPI001CD27580|nr:flagellar hook-basal body protein [Halobacillus litoralis]MCA1020934.1 flagellar hook-basal body protein [Halobacillus litoralis]
MLRGFYTAASGMMASQRMQEMLSNNISNVETPGYKQTQGSLRAFPELLLQQMGSKTLPGSTAPVVPDQSRVGSLHTGVYLQETTPDFSQGALKETGVSTDMALVADELPDADGAVLFQVENGNGETRYTRNGSFTVDDEGFLTTNTGYRILDDTGNPINTAGQAFQVSRTGMLTTADAGSQLAVAYIPAANALVPQGSDLYVPGENAGPIENALENEGVDFSVHQHFIERSNVDLNRTMTDMMNTYRSFEMNQRVLKAYDQSMQQAVSEIGRIR